MKRKFNEDFKKDFMRMQKGEDWNKIKEKYKDISQFQWDKEKEEHFKIILAEYSKDEDYRKNKKKS